MLFFFLKLVRKASLMVKNIYRSVLSVISNDDTCLIPFSVYSGALVTGSIVLVITELLFQI